MPGGSGPFPPVGPALAGDGGKGVACPCLARRRPAVPAATASLSRHTFHQVLRTVSADAAASAWPAPSSTPWLPSAWATAAQFGRRGRLSSGDRRVWWSHMRSYTGERPPRCPRGPLAGRGDDAVQVHVRLAIPCHRPTYPLLPMSSLAFVAALSQSRPAFVRPLSRLEAATISYRPSDRSRGPCRRLSARVLARTADLDPVHLPFVRRPRGSALGRRLAGCPSSRHALDGTARSGGQGRRCLAPGPGPRAATRRPGFGPSMASTGRTHPLPAASTVASSQTPAARVIHRGSRAYARRILGF